MVSAGTVFFILSDNNKGGSQGEHPGVLVLSSYQKPYTKALGKDGIFNSQHADNYVNKQLRFGFKSEVTQELSRQCGMMPMHKINGH